jgi:hypothetical protein
MQFKIELRYLGGWDDACWTEEADQKPKPLRFETVDDAQAALREFFADVANAVAAGDMDVPESPEDYRIVAANDWD